MDSTDEEAAAWTPPPGWLTAYQEQATPGLLKKATRFANGRARMIGRVTHKADPLYGRELVQDALVDTFTGVVRWDPDRTSLLDHVQGVVKSRSRHDLIRATRSPMRSIDDAADAADGTSNDGRPVEREASMAVARARHATAAEAATHAHAAAVLDGLSTMLDAHDRDARALLGAYKVGKTARTEVMALTGMSAATYHNQRRRIVRLARKLPASPGES